MDLINIFLLSLVQGVTEFLPISSSLPSTAAKAEPFTIGVLSPGNF